MTEAQSAIGVARVEPTHRLSLRANFAWTFVGNSAYAASQWAMLIVLAKIGSPQAVGQFSLGLAVAAPIMLLCNLNLRGVQATDARDDYRFSEYLGLRSATTFVALAAILAVALAVEYQPQTRLLILILGLAKAIESISDIIFGLQQKAERMDRIAISMMIKGVFSVLVLSLLLWSTGSVIWATLGLAATWLIVLLTYDSRNARQLSSVRPSWDGSVLMHLARLALPLGFVMMLVSLTSNVPRYFIERVLDERQLGYFSAIAYLMLMGNTVVGALGQSASPRLARHFARGERRAFVRILAGLVAIGVALGVLGFVAALLLGKPILTLLYQPDYAQHVDVFVWLMLAALISYVAACLGYAMTAQRRFKEQVPLFVVVVIVLIIGCAILTPRNGILGAAQAMVAANLVQMAGAAIVNAQALQSMAHKKEGTLA